jgi:hypothetical protein
MSFTGGMGTLLLVGLSGGTGLVGPPARCNLESIRQICLTVCTLRNRLETDPQAALPSDNLMRPVHRLSFLQ